MCNTLIVVVSFTYIYTHNCEYIHIDHAALFKLLCPPTVFVFFPADSRELCCPAMHSLSQEIQGFSKNRLKKQCTRVTTVTGRRLLERRSDGAEGGEQVEELEEGSGCGFVEDESLDLQVGVVRPFLLLGNIQYFKYNLLYTLDEYFYYDCYSLLQVLLQLQPHLLLNYNHYYSF